VGGLFVSGLAGALGFLLAGVAVGAAGKVWDDTPAGQDGALARAARSLAAVSASAPVPVVVILDHVGDLDEDLAFTLIDSLISRHSGQVLVVAAALPPGSRLAAGLRSRSWYGLLAGRVQHADADPDMGYQSRLALTTSQLPHLPAPAAERIAQRTRNFAEVLALTAAGRLAELTEADDQAAVPAASTQWLMRGWTAPRRRRRRLCWLGPGGWPTPGRPMQPWPSSAPPATTATPTWRGWDPSPG
jgi:hypothetical protein